MTLLVDPPLRADGWLSGVERSDSPNHDARPAGVAITLIVIHAISLPPGEFVGNAVGELFTNRLDPQAHPYFAGIATQRVSAHFFIRRDGAVTQFVSCRQRAWHAGASCWQGRERCNDFSLGIELEGDDLTKFAPLQYQALAGLLTVLRQHFPIESVVGHADIAPGRKTDPGPHFDWTCIAPVMPR
jgi:AmpD protein